MSEVIATEKPAFGQQNQRNDNNKPQGGFNQNRDNNKPREDRKDWNNNKPAERSEAKPTVPATPQTRLKTAMAQATKYRLEAKLVMFVAMTGFIGYNVGGLDVLAQTGQAVSSSYVAMWIVPITVAATLLGSNVLSSMKK